MEQNSVLNFSFWFSTTFFVVWGQKKTFSTTDEKGSYFQQIVRYGKHGHYHAHFDSETDKRTDKRCCQLYEDVVQAFNKDEGCRLCRWAYTKVQLNGDD